MITLCRPILAITSAEGGLICVLSSSGLPVEAVKGPEIRLITIIFRRFTKLLDVSGYDDGELWFRA